ncbi:MAG: GNAT family N-acetyltransferase [Lachnospiraceae bacterium]
MIEYKHTKEIEVEKISQLFEAVGWYSSKQPYKLQQAFRNSSKVITAWEGDKLVGLVRGLDDGVWQATIDCLLVLPGMQGRGIASELLRMIVKEYEEILYIDVVPEEKRMFRFMRRMDLK